MKMNLYVTTGLIVTVIIGIAACGSPEKISDPVLALEQDKLQQALSPCKEIDGYYLKAFIEAHKTFLNDDVIPVNLRKIENYTVSFREDRNKLLVDYLAKMTTKEEQQDRVGGGTSLGVSCTYILNKDNYQVISKIHPK